MNKSKVSICLLLLLTLFFFGGNVFSQKTIDSYQKEIKRSVRKLKRKGYYVNDFDQTMREQMETVYKFSAELDELGKPLYLISSGIATASTENVARINALNLAKGDIVTKLTSVIYNTFKRELRIDNNKYLDSITMVAVSRAKQKLGQIRILAEIYRRKEKDEVECVLQVAYNREFEQKIIKEIVKNNSSGKNTYYAP